MISRSLKDWSAPSPISFGTVRPSRCARCSAGLGLCGWAQKHQCQKGSAVSWGALPAPVPLPALPEPLWERGRLGKSGASCAGKLLSCCRLQHDRGAPAGLDTGSGVCLHFSLLEIPSSCYLKEFEVLIEINFSWNELNTKMGHLDRYNWVAPT